jgi:hypothetical protein
MGSNQKERHRLFNVIRFVMHLLCVFIDAVLPVDFVSICRVICKIEKQLGSYKRWCMPVDSCRVATSSYMYFCSFWHLDCNGCNPMCLEREEVKEMVGNQLSCHSFSVDFPVWNGRIVEYLCHLLAMPVMMKNWFSMTRWMRHLENVMCPKQQIHGTTKFWDASQYHHLTLLTSTQQCLFSNGNAW